MSNSILAFAHSTEVKKVGIIAVAALKDVFDSLADKYPVPNALQALGDDFFIALGERLEHLEKNQEAKQESVAAVTTEAPQAAQDAVAPVA